MTVCTNSRIVDRVACCVKLKRTVRVRTQSNRTGGSCIPQDRIIWSENTVLTQATVVHCWIFQFSSGSESAFILTPP